MAKLHDVLMGLTIIARYQDEDEKDPDCFQAQYDQIFCGEYSGHRMIQADLDAMKAAGWRENEGAWWKSL